MKLTRYLQRKWWKWCKHIIACSEFLRQILIQHHDVPPDKVQRIFNAYHGPAPDSVTETRDEACTKLGLDTSRRYMLTICRLMVWKRVDGILRALAELPQDVTLLIAGDGDMEEEWKALARELGVADRAQFLGNVPHSEIPLWIRAADVFCLNSEYEGLSHTLLEVLTLGTPIIASSVCGNPEVVEHEKNGLLVDPDRWEELRDAASKILEDRDLGRRYAEEGLARRDRYSREGTFSDVEAALSAVSGRDTEAN